MVRGNVLNAGTFLKETVGMVLTHTGEHGTKIAASATRSFGTRFVLRIVALLRR
jgi:hypothetical protein